MHPTTLPQRHADTRKKTIYPLLGLEFKDIGLEYGLSLGTDVHVKGLNVSHSAESTSDRYETLVMISHICDCVDEDLVRIDSVI